MARFSFPSHPAPSGVSAADWSDWTWQLRHALRTRDDFERVFELSSDERTAFENSEGLFNIRATPYYASLAGPHPQDPLRLILMPRTAELAEGVQQMKDPLAEGKNSVAPRIVHRYSDRVLFLVTDFCSVYCRYCTRKHFTGSEQAFIRADDYAKALDYIRSHPGVREVILSGGDPLTLSDAQIGRVIADLRRIDHVEIIRLGSRMPVVSPMRLTPSLIESLRGKPGEAPVYLMTHFNHPREITAEAAEGLTRMVDAGLPVMNQMVLLNGINNHPAVVQALSRRLLFLRVKPYYMFQCDPSVGTDHLRTSIDESLAIQRELWGHLSGLAMPTYAVDIPSGGGKTVLTPDFETSRRPAGRSYRGWDGVEAEYLNPSLENRRSPIDAELYLQEWETLKSAKLGRSD